MTTSLISETDAQDQTAAADAARSVEGLAAHMGRNICQGFITHDARDRAACIEAFFEVDRHQFAHLADDEAYLAATAYVDALWAKDDVEAPHVREDGTFDADALDDADWSPVVEALERRADIVGMPAEYATATTDGWRLHKTGGDYWTPHMIAQRHEVRAALADPDYPHKRGTSPTGVGVLPARYLVGIELHDMKTEETWREAAAVMESYFADILRGQRD